MTLGFALDAKNHADITKCESFERIDGRKEVELLHSTLPPLIIKEMFFGRAQIFTSVSIYESMKLEIQLYFSQVNEVKKSSTSNRSRENDKEVDTGT